MILRVRAISACKNPKLVQIIRKNRWRVNPCARNVRMSEEKSSEKTLYRAGTLAYTLSGLVALVCFMVWGDFTWMLRMRTVTPSATIILKNIGVSDFVYALIDGVYHAPGFPESTANPPSPG